LDKEGERGNEKKKRKRERQEKKKKNNIAEKYVIAGLSPKWSVVLSPDSKVDI